MATRRHDRFTRSLSDGHGFSHTVQDGVAEQCQPFTLSEGHGFRDAIKGSLKERLQPLRERLARQRHFPRGLKPQTRRTGQIARLKPCPSERSALSWPTEKSPSPKRPSDKETEATLSSQAGVTLVELIVVISIIAILASAAIPVTRWQVKRTKERELRAALWEMRGAIDKYKDAADRGAFQTKVDSFNYPPDLQTLVDGVDVQSKKVKFLRSIPKDPMTGDTDWQLRSMQDDADSQSFGGQNVFDVHSKSQGTALDGTKYSDW